MDNNVNEIKKQILKLMAICDNLRRKATDNWDVGCGQFEAFCQQHFNDPDCRNRLMELIVEQRKKYAGHEPNDNYTFKHNKNPSYDYSFPIPQLPTLPELASRDPKNLFKNLDPVATSNLVTLLKQGTQLCLKCPVPDHFITDCPDFICWNCRKEAPGHRLNSCPGPIIKNKKGKRKASSNRNSPSNPWTKLRPWDRIDRESRERGEWQPRSSSNNDGSWRDDFYDYDDDMCDEAIHNINT
jgi:hypothetical protein